MANYSRQRSVILDILLGTKSHPTAEWVYDECRKILPNISLGTVYRNLNLLVDMGEIVKVQSSFEKDRFDADCTRHAHTVCTLCGKVWDTPAPDNIRADLDEYCRESGCENYALTFYGECDECRGKFD